MVRRKMNGYSRKHGRNSVHSIYRNADRCSRQCGFTLLEVLIALIILSIGLLGLAGLQTTSLKYNHDAQLRSQASLLAYDMADRMRANHGEAQNGAYDTSYADDPECDRNFTPSGPLANADVDGWLNRIACALPMGNGSVSVSGDFGTVRVRWDDSRGEEDAREFIFTVRL